MNVSSVPISSKRRNIHHRYNGPAYDDLTKQRLAQPDSEHDDHGQLVEDHLEDLVNLPIASELIPRRARSKVSLAASDSTHNTSIFPQASTSNLDLVAPAPQVQQSTIPSNDSRTVFKLDAPPKRSDSLRKRTQSTPLKAPPQPLPNGNAQTSTITNSNKKSKVDQAPLNSYPSPLTLLSLPTFTPILYSQPYNTRRAIGHAIVSNILKKETVISTPEEVKGILELCHVLMKDQKDASIGGGMQMRGSMPGQLNAHQSMQGRGMMRGMSGRGSAYDMEEMAEEQGWIARLVHLFRSDDDDVQFKLLQTARSQFAEGGDRIRWTFPPLIVSAVKLARRRRANAARSGISDGDLDGEAKASTLFRFIHQVISTLYNSPSDASDICLRLYLLSLQAADESDLEELAYEFAVQAFTIYEESISESRAQLQAITLIIGALQQTRVFTADNYDTLITKAALHGAKLLKKGHQATAVMLASHLWWQTETAGGSAREGKPLCRDGKRVLECLQKALRIATNCIDELTTVQLYVDALDKYIYYLERGTEAITPKHINSLVELITSNIDNLHASDVHPTSASATAGLVEGVSNPDAVIQHFRSTLAYLHSRKETTIMNDGASEVARNFGEIDLVGSLLKMGLQ